MDKEIQSAIATLNRKIALFAEARDGLMKLSEPGDFGEQSKPGPVSSAIQPAFQKRTKSRDADAAKSYITQYKGTFTVDEMVMMLTHAGINGYDGKGNTRIYTLLNTMLKNDLLEKDAGSFKVKSGPSESYEEKRRRLGLEPKIATEQD